MKVVQEGQASLLGGVDAPVNMGISDDPEDQLMILNVLSNSLYTDKPAAVLREYGCNAFDANVEAGRGHQPIEVRLPNKLDPTLAIRDFGFGMSEAQILNTFIRLGRSTKRQSNAFTGMLGIGSKAGFAYGDSFLVTSWCNGSKAVYNCFRDRGMPKLAKMHEESSDAPDGVEIKVPIRMEDFQTFITKAEEIYRYFKVRPIIHGAKLDWQARGVPEFQGTGWRYTGIGHSVAIMGNVGYTLTTTALPQAKIGARLQTLINLGVELDFEIGDLEIAANREGLQYKDHTITSIVKRLDEVATEVTKVFTDKIAKATSCWDAHRMYGDNFEKMGQSHYGMRSLKEVVNVGIMWQGQKITTGRFELLTPSVTVIPGVHVVEYSKRYSYSRMDKRDNPHDTYASEKTQLVINDLPTKTNSPLRAKGHFERNPDCERFVTFTFDTPAIEKKYWKQFKLDGAPTINLSTVAPAVSVAGVGGSTGPSAHRAKHSAKCFELIKGAPTGYIGRAQSKWWEKAEVDLDSDSGLYVVIENFKPIINNGVTYLRDVNQFHNDVSTLRKAGIITGTIYGFKKAVVPRLGTGWVTLEAHIKANIDKWVKANAQNVADSDASLAHKEWIKRGWSKQFNAASVMHKYLKAFETMTANGKTVNEMVDDIRRGYNLLLPKSLLTNLPKPTHDLDAMAAEVRKTYPLLAILDKQSPYVWGYDGARNLLQHAVNYVQMVGK